MITRYRSSLLFLAIFLLYLSFIYLTILRFDFSVAIFQVTIRFAQVCFVICKKTQTIENLSDETEDIHKWDTAIIKYFVQDNTVANYAININPVIQQIESIINVKFTQVFASGNANIVFTSGQLPLDVIARTNMKTQ